MSSSNLLGIYSYYQKKDPIMDNPLSPPLPLLKFDTLPTTKTGPFTVSGENLKSIPNKLEGCITNKPDKIFDPILARKLSRWFVARSQKEVNYKQMEAYTKHFQNPTGDEQKIELFEYIVYESLLYVESKSERIERNSRRPSEMQVHLIRQQEKLNDEAAEASNIIRRSYSNSSLASSSGEEGDRANRTLSSPPHYTPSVVFDSEFESGNLEKAVRVVGRETILSEKALEYINDYAVPTEVDQEYDLTLRNDINTDGNIQWYYYSVKVDTEIDGVEVNFPLKVRFNLINMQKKDSLYNYGMRPAIYSVLNGQENDWFNGGYDICYYKNGLTNCKAGKKKPVVRNQYTFTFTYTFETPDTVYFAYTFPYTYSDLQRYLSKLEADPIASNYFHRRNLCNTLAGNRCDVLTITERSNGAVESKYKPGIIISGRIHPGGSNSSYVVHGLIDFLCSSAPEAVKLRKAFIFTIVPMLNVDGVIHGNYRCSLAGTDLNRRFTDCHPSLHPVIVAFKELVRTIQMNRTIALFLDLHGHSKLKNSFIYGCDLTLQPDKYTKYLTTNLRDEEVNQRRIFCRIFPKILCTMSKSTNPTGYFSYRDCSFKIDKSKFGTGRVVSWRDLGVLASYTIEISFCGNGDNNEKKILKKCFDQGGSNNGGSLKATRGGKVAKTKKKPKRGKRRKSRLISLVEGDVLCSNGDEGAVNEAANDDDIIDEDEEENNEIENADQDFDAEVINTNWNGSSKSTSVKNTIVPLDSNVLALVDSYKTAAHYHKHDLITMGKQICQAIFHFANLTHADLEYEKELIMQHDRDLKEKLRKAEVEKQLMTKYPINSGSIPISSSNSGYVSGSSSNADTPNVTCTSPVMGNGKNPSGDLNKPSSNGIAMTGSTKNRIVSEKDEIEDDEEIDYYKQAIDALYGPNTSYQRGNDAISRLPVEFSLSNSEQSNSFAIVEGESGKFAQKESVTPQHQSGSYNYDNAEQLGIANSSFKERGIKILGDEADNPRENIDDDGGEGEDENSCADSEESGGNGLEAANNAAEGSGNATNNNTGNNGATGTSSGHNLSEIFSNYLAAPFESYEQNMSIRAITKNGVFRLSTIQSLIQNYSQEFLVEKSSINVGFRIKCELAIRKLLKLDEKIDAALISSSNYFTNLLEDEADSGDESESNPSIDNQPTAKLLKAMQVDGGTLNMNVVNTLKQALRKKKHKELLLKKKRDKKLALKLMKQAEAARKLALENERLAQKERDERARQRPYSASSIKFDAKRRKSGGIHSSLPKFAPLYRMAPAEPKINVPVQIKIVQFKDFDRKQKQSTQSSWSRTNNVFYDEESYVPPPTNISPVYELPAEIPVAPKVRRGSSIHLNSPTNRQKMSTLSDVNQSWTPKVPVQESVSHLIHGNHVQILVSSDTTNPSNRTNDANIVYAPVDLSPVIPQKFINNSPIIAQRPKSHYVLKEVGLDFNIKDTPSTVNLKRISQVPVHQGNHGSENIISQTFGTIPQIPPNSADEFLQTVAVAEQVLAKQFTPNTPEKGSPKPSRRRSTITI